MGEDFSTRRGMVRGHRGPIAIVGMSGRFPGARELGAFWANLSQGVDSVTGGPRERWGLDASSDSPSALRGGFLDAVEDFDPGFFGLSSRDAARMDPQQRLLLEHCWMALEDSGLPTTGERRRAGVFMGLRASDYPSGLDGAHEEHPRLLSGDDASQLLARVSRLLGLQGPGLVVDASCASSLVAIHLACEQLSTGSLEWALAGGAFVMATARMHRAALHAGSAPLTPLTEGFVPAEGVGVVVLKPLERALADGDRIHGVIRGSDTVQGGRLPGEPPSNDSHSRSDFIRAVYQQAEIEPETVSYLEAHGIGVRRRDDVELEALSRVFPSRTDPCSIGSVGGNVGHAAAAAGMAGLLKILLAFEHRQLPPSLHSFAESDPARFERTPFRVPTKPCPWVGTEGAPRRAAISAFSPSGTDCHLILEEPPLPLPRAADPGRPAYVFILSARSDEALGRFASELIERLGRSLSDGDAPHPGDVAFTLARGRGTLARRAAFVASDLQEFISLLTHYRDTPAARPGPGPGPGALSDSSRNLLREMNGRLLRSLDLEAPGDVWRETLKASAELYVLGVDLERSVLFPDGVYRCVALPTHPFARERCWLQGPVPRASLPAGTVPVPSESLAPRSVGPAPVPVSVPTESPDEAPSPVTLLPENALLLEKGWGVVEEQAHPAALELEGTLVVLVNEETLALAQEALASLRDTRLFLIANRGNACPGVHALLDFDRYEAGVRLGEELNARRGPLAGIIDLSDLRTAPHAEEEDGSRRMETFGRIGMLQTLLKRSRTESFALLHFTRGLRTFMGSGALDLGGGVMAALVGKLGAEYPALHARTVDLEKVPDSAVALESLLREEHADQDSGGEVLHRRGRRYVPRMHTLLSTPGPAPRMSSEKVYVITGGVRGIGLEVARHLVSRGARRLVLMGLQPLPPQDQWDALLAQEGCAPELRERLAPLRALRARGVRLRIHCGALTDFVALEALFGEVRASLGPIAGCVHSAGAVFFTPPAFTSKPVGQLLRVLEPKVEGLLTLERALARDPLEFFVLFSSVSALAPSLAVGLLDYSAANEFMNLWVEHRRAAGRVSHQSILWPNWKDVGMGEVKSPAYQALGLAAHSTADGLALLDATLASGRAVLLPAIVEPNLFSPDDLLRSRNRSPPVRDLPRASPPAAPPSPELPAPVVPRVAPASASRISSGQELLAFTTRWLRQLFAKELQVPQEQIASDADFETLGLDSILVIEVVMKLDEWLGVKLDPSLPLLHRTLTELGGHLVEAYPEAVLEAHARSVPSVAVPLESERLARKPEPVAPPLPAPTPPVPQPPPSAGGLEPIAVIGMACHFPGSTDLEAYWRVLREGRDLITEVPASRWRIADFHSPTHQPGRSIGRWGGFIEGIELFDPDYFQIARADAPCIDPLMRQFLEVSVQGLRHAGYAPREVAGRRVGVFVGSRMSGYSARMPAPTRNGVIGSGQNFIAAHVSHFLDLKGPGLVVDTACSSSLVAIHLACQSLRSGESELALAGGVDILLDEAVYLTLSESRALSRDGRCKTFDEKADGFVPGEGAGVVLLKPLRKALADGDRIYGVIDATAVNNDGHTMGATTPNPAGQRAVIEEALRQGRVDPRTLGYVEAHGTGTMLGDPIELKSLTEVLAPAGVPPGSCAVGTVKSNFGHLLSAAGVAGFIKVVLSLMHRELPPTLHCTTPNPRFHFESSPLFPNTRLRPWEPRGGVRRAGLSAFGFGGTNAHALVSEAPDEQQPVRAPLSPVVFNRQRYWLEALSRRAAPVQEPPGESTPRRKLAALEFGATG
ncbi:beta-ketoacyl synthase N-terminal-like domain-containing protein [Corallococcus sp. bb12-1]|uniref:type I polyketide synthase n=1 Tax=Corallococcus sp. bb12-1 TaxID=2996784 RepID=UPI00226EE91F|nr:beta-ketoacyl synthase N-terminal-like domain-containing protein [Corallococcus sp. bb12-1]MCY1047770.1 beta-ketoacyl synthase N-terminal-like domain-containing protein [Corallococcus sp. bb12-1]